MQKLDTPVIVGNPFSPTGRGVTALSFLRAFKAAHLPLPIKDIYSYGHTNDINIITEIQNCLVDNLSKVVNIYHINVDEIEPTFTALNNELPDGSYNIIYPFWELSKIPANWIEKLDLFDEIWAPSFFIQKAIESSLAKPIYLMPLPVQIKLASFLGRRYFNLPESSYLFLFLFDFRSYIARKNPSAVLDVFEQVYKENQDTDVRVVIKVHGDTSSPKADLDYKDFLNRIRQSPFCERIILINKAYDDNEIKNLIRCCDCFVSLHRSEGFGLGMAEAMYLGKPVIATAYSGNLDFMNNQVACLVDYNLVAVQEGQYPNAIGQVWAEPDVNHAAHFMNKMLKDQEFGRKLGKQARKHICIYFSYLAQGLRYKQRINQILQEKYLS